MISLLIGRQPWNGYGKLRKNKEWEKDMDKKIDRFYRNECWIGDTYVLNYINGKKLEMRYLLIFMDVCSGQITGWHIAEEVGRDTELEALRVAIQMSGIPGEALMDKGRLYGLPQNNRQYRKRDTFRKLDRFFTLLLEFLQEEIANMPEDRYPQRVGFLGGHVAFFICKYNEGKVR